LAEGGDVNAKVNAGCTPLERAAISKIPKSPTCSANTTARREKNWKQ